MFLSIEKSLSSEIAINSSKQQYKIDSEKISEIAKVI